MVLIAYLAATALVGIFMSYVWSSNGFVNCFIKTCFTIYAVVGIWIFLAKLTPLVEAHGMKLL